MCEDVIARTVEELSAEADIDFVDISLIAESLREDLELQTQHDIRRQTLKVIERLMDRGIHPGDYDQATTLTFWPGEPCEHLQRIEAEWVAMGHTPTLEQPICWFGLKRSDPA